MSEPAKSGLAVMRPLATGEAVDEALSPWGTLHVERSLPFLIVVRGPRDDQLARLVRAEPSYLVASDQPGDEAGVSALVRAVVETVAPKFGAFLLLEIWSLPIEEATSVGAGPRFELQARSADDLGAILTRLADDLAKFTHAGRNATVEISQSDLCAPPGQRPLLDMAEAAEFGCVVVGLAIAPIHVDKETSVVLPDVERALRSATFAALRKAFHGFYCDRTTQCPVNYQVLGSRALDPAVWAVDEQLAAVADSFDFLLQVTPVNHQEAFKEFERSGFERAPVFQYRPKAVDTIVLKRRLYGALVETVDDPAMAHLLREKLDELDRMVTLLNDLDTPRFLSGTAQLYGAVDDELLRDARGLLERAREGERPTDAGIRLDANEIARRATEEIQRHYSQPPDVMPTVEIRNDIASGLMVSRGRLFVGEYAQIPETRIDALFAHEIGTHLLTYYNGRSQPLRQLSSGLAGYEELQEGTAVLAEYLVGGLSEARLAILASRVVAVRLMLEGASFVDVFRELTKTWGISASSAFAITTRVYRGGGMCKDAVYLRGLSSVLNYIHEGGDIDMLFIGKLALSHIPILRELRFRNVLHASRLRPYWLDRPDVKTRIDGLRRGATLADLYVS